MKMTGLIASFAFIILFVLFYYIAQSQTWIQQADFGGDERYAAVGFSVNDKGYLGLGIDIGLNKKVDVWEFDISSGEWIFKTIFPGNFIECSVGFSINSKGYIAVDQSHDFWEYNPATDTWTQMADFPGSVVGAAAFSIDKKGYIVTGSYFRSLWEWEGDTTSPLYNTWLEKAPFPPLEGRFGGVAFSIGKKGYFGTGTNGISDMNDFWEWDGDTSSPTYNTWTQKASLPSWERIYSIGFSIGEFGFIGTGQNGWNNLILNDLWKWNSAIDTWEQMPDLPGVPRMEAVAFSIGQSGYIGTGGGPASQNLKDFWQFCDTCHVQVTENENPGNLIIYPNPAREIIQIRSNCETEFKAVLLNLFGNRLLNATFKNEIILNVRELPCGIYILRCSSHDHIYSCKIIIER